MDWLRQNSNSSDAVLVGDSIVYQYFIGNPLVSYSQANMWVSQFLQKNRISDPLVGYAAFLATYHIKYFVAYDSTMSWFYTYTKDMALSFTGKQYNFNGIVVRLIPLKKFEKNNEQVILYKVEVEETVQELPEQNTENSNSTESSNPANATTN